MKLQGTNAIITGASQGLGLEIARHFLSEGASVALCARDAVKLNSAVSELRAVAGDRRIVALPCDVSNEAEIGAFVTQAIRQLGSIQALVNNAGIYGPKGPSETVDWREWKRAIEINLFGVMLPVRAIIPHFKSQGRGKIINLSGGGASRCRSSAPMQRPRPRLCASLRRWRRNCDPAGSTSTRSHPAD
jgi:NAD(P)-dependent dehydrogenase (short-subunit alcohol dehydrogenase family)